VCPRHRSHVSDDVNNPPLSERVDTLFNCTNRFDTLEEKELSAEVCIAASVVEKLDPNIEWNFEQKNNICVLRNTQKPVIVLKTENDFLNALVDTGSERCIVKYENLRCMDKQSVKSTNVKIKGIVGNAEVVGEVTLNLNFRNNQVVTTDALIIKNASFDYDIILGRDILKDAQLDFNKKCINIKDTTVEFISKSDGVRSKREQIFSALSESECLVSNIISLKKRRKKNKIVTKTNKQDVSKVADVNVHGRF